MSGERETSDLVICPRYLDCIWGNHECGHSTVHERESGCEASCLCHRNNDCAEPCRKVTATDLIVLKLTE